LDRNIPLNGSFNVMGRSVIIHNLATPDNSKLAWGIIAVLAE